MRNVGDLARRGGPVLALHTVAATDRLRQQALAVHQRHRHAVDLGLRPDIRAITQPVFDGATVTQFFQAGMRHRVDQRSGRGAQWIGGHTEAEALAPLGQACQGLIVEFVGNQRATFTVIAVIPALDLFLQYGDFLRGTCGWPGGAFAGSSVQARESEE
ncbi:hypothetical protein D3C73_1082270 [compost metagenome]